LNLTLRKSDVDGNNSNDRILTLSEGNSSDLPALKNDPFQNKSDLNLNGWRKSYFLLKEDIHSCVVLASVTLHSNNSSGHALIGQLQFIPEKFREMKCSFMKVELSSFEKKEQYELTTVSCLLKWTPFCNNAEVLPSYDIYFIFKNSDAENATVYIGTTLNQYFMVSNFNFPKVPNFSGRFIVRAYLPWIPLLPLSDCPFVKII